MIHFAFAILLATADGDIVREQLRFDDPATCESMRETLAARFILDTACPPEG